MHLPEEPLLSRADTVLGQLQRGRGNGWRRAVTSRDGPDLLRECLAFDPRWDHQVESRADYYASLAIELGLQGGDLFTDEQLGDSESIALEVAIAMDTRGALQPGPALARAMATAKTSDCGMHPGEITPGPGLSRGRASAVWPGPDESLEAFLALGPPGIAMSRAWRHRVRFMVSPDEVRVLREVATQTEHVSWRLAMSSLALRGDDSAVVVAAAVLAAESFGARRAAAYVYVSQLPEDIALPIAREWWDHPDSRGDAARNIMGKHARVQDAPAVRTALARADNYYEICSLVDALGRLPTLGPFPELDGVYARAAYSYARERAAIAMAATDPGFARQYAEECLWDCEPGTVDVGIRHAPPTAAATARIESLSNPPEAPTGPSNSRN